jgi:hypothetical protein
LQEKVNDIQTQIDTLQARLKEVTNGAAARPAPARSSSAASSSTPRQTPTKKTFESSKPSPDDNPKKKKTAEEGPKQSSKKPGATGGDGKFTEFPEYDGSEAPVDPKKAFTQFCLHTRRSVKNSLNPEDRRDKQKVHAILKDRWHELSEDEKDVYRKWAEWDRQRYAHEQSIFAKHQKEVQHEDEEDVSMQEANTSDALHVPKKKKKRSMASANNNEDSVPLKRPKK